MNLFNTSTNTDESIFYFVRHGEADYDSLGDWNDFHMGRDFAPLTDKGRKQIAKTAKELREVSPQIIITSPYTRAMETANIISRELNLPIVVEKNLHEWVSDTTHTRGKAEELLPLCDDFTQSAGIHFNGAKDWESSAALRSRVLGVLEKYRGYERIVVVGHALMMDAVIGAMRPYENGEIVTYKAKKQGKLPGMTYYPPDTLENMGFVSIFARYQGKWIYCWHKRRQSFERPGGHVESGESALEAAKRELYEESGITDCTFTALCDYEFVWDTGVNSNNGRYYYAEVHSLGEIPESEMDRIELFDEVPKNCTYDRATEQAMLKLVDKVLAKLR
ncbi:MAG: histidine phosphatase family protein [Lachnospiraceae bacterium]|nr:histidine phosphatase family protein [Lachnospiraceae bacterium]